MIKFDLLENGADSLKSAYNKMQVLNDLQEGLDHYLKDIVFFLNHGIEILFKYVLKAKDESLIFSNQRKYEIAKQEMLRLGKSNVFEISPNLKTVTLSEAIKICKENDLEVSEEYHSSLTYLNKMRNQFMHYEVFISDEEMLKLLVRQQAIFELTMEFFKLHIPNFIEYFEGARFEDTIEDYGDILAEMQREADFERYIDEMMVSE
ncbi:hypothetical protein [Paenibacillus sp. O199]|uniref:hypothetical protein n=1 Tax=Paenibacillus sp. O199 TaxID=1643925 RepID=UPI0007BF8D61|nr:hypothetical protein [Paenibacillus sp. O199]